MVYALSTLLSMEQDEALLMRLAMHFECVHDKIGHVAVLSEALTTLEAQRAREAVLEASASGSRTWRLWGITCGPRMWRRLPSAYNEEEEEDTALQ